MYHQLPGDASFWLFLFSIDRDLAETARKAACPCGGHLHVSNYPRKPRGGPDDLPEAYCFRLSFCCDRDGCRKRVTPPSVRFLGPKVYLATVVILVTAMRQGPTPRGARELSRLFGADRRTIARWQVFWCEHFPRTAFWKAMRGRFVPAVAIVSLPRSLLDAFLQHADGERQGWERLLRFLSPVTTPGSPTDQGLAMIGVNPQKMHVDAAD
jgi:hypothetical protein